MNIWHMIVIKVSTAIVAILVFVGLAQPVLPPQVTTVQVESSGQVSSTTAPMQIQQSFLIPAPTQSPAPVQEPAPATNTITPTDQPAMAPEPAPATPAPAPQTIYVPIFMQVPAQTPTPVPAPASEPTIIQPETMSPKPTPSQKELKLINPIADKGLGRQYLARPQIKDEFNYIDIGLVVYNDEGTPIKNAVVEIVATDASQSKTMNATGNVKKIYVDGSSIMTPYYPFHYEFKTPGDHKITFTAEGLISEVILSAPEDTRP